MPTGNEFSDVQLSGDRTFNPPGDKTGDPKQLLQQATVSVRAHADLVESYGLCQPTADLGSHPWLRDSLTNRTELEPGPAEPKPGIKIPKVGQ